MNALFLAALLFLPQDLDTEAAGGHFVARAARAPGFEDAREDHAVWQVDVVERTARGERLRWSERLTTEQLGDVRRLAPDGSAFATVRAEVFGSRPLVRVFRDGGDPRGLDEDDLGLYRRDLPRGVNGRLWLANGRDSVRVGWRDERAGPRLVLEIEAVDGRLFVVDLASGRLLGSERERAVVTVEPGLFHSNVHRPAARVTGFVATPVVLVDEALRVDVHLRHLARVERFAGFELEFRGADRLVLIPRLERVPALPHPGVHSEAAYEVTARISGLEPGEWQLAVEGAGGPVGDPARVDVLAPGLALTLRTRHAASGRVAETVDLFERGVARRRSARGELSFHHVPEELLEEMLRHLDRLPRYGYERTSRNGRDADRLLYEITWWPRLERRTVLVDGRTARGRVEDLIALLLELG